MYEHLRNDFLSKLMLRYGREDVNFIGSLLDKVASETLALQSGMPITQVQKMLGHSNVNTTQIYAETSQAEVALAHKKYVI